MHTVTSTYSHACAHTTHTHTFKILGGWVGRTNDGFTGTPAFKKKNYVGVVLCVGGP